MAGDRGPKPPVSVTYGEWKEEDAAPAPVLGPPLRTRPEPRPLPPLININPTQKEEDNSFELITSICSSSFSCVCCLFLLLFFMTKR